MKFLKFHALILALILCLGAFAACGPTQNENESDNNIENTTETQAPAQSEESETAAEGETVERFDYDSADISKHINIERNKYTNASITLPSALEVTEASVAEYIALLCQEYSTLSNEKITDRAIKEGDVAMIYYEGYRDGVLFDGGSNMSAETPTPLQIGSGQFIPGFEEGLIGVVPAETARDNMVEIPLTFPEDYHNAEMAGVAVVFKVYVEYITQYVPAEYTEAFITDTLEFSPTSDDVKGEFEEYIESYLLSNLESEIRGGVWLSVIDAVEVLSLPQSEVDYYYNLAVEEYEYYMQNAPYFWGLSFSDLDSFAPFYIQQAYGYQLAEDESWEDYTRLSSERSVKQNLAFRFIAQKEGFVVSDSAYRDAINYYVNYYAYYGYTYTEEQIVDMVGEDVLKEFALFETVTAFILENCSVTYED